MSKTYTQEEFDKALSKGIAAATGRREEQLGRKIKELGFDSVEQVKEFKTNYENIIGERDRYKTDFENLQNEATISAKKTEIKGLGVDDTFVDYIYNTVEDGNYEEYITANPKFKAENFSKGGSQPLVNKTQPNENEDKMREAAGLPPKK